jgi:hypothetical protein
LSPGVKASIEAGLKHDMQSVVMQTQVSAFRVCIFLQG